MRRFSRPRSTPAPSRFRPFMEALEDRYCLSYPTLSLAATAQDAHTVLLSGRVDDDGPADLTVLFAGDCTGSAITDDEGNFSLTEQVAEAGAVQATVVDGEGNSAYAQVWYTLPSLTLNVVAVDTHTVSLSGTVTDADPSHLTVLFSGAFAGSTVTTADGTYALTAQVSGAGTIHANFTDGASATADEVAASYTLPVAVTLTSAVQDTQTVVLSGQVTDLNPGGAGGLTVTFTGAYEGSTVTNADGSYSLTAAVASSGGVGATVTDGNGITSEVAATSFTLPVPLAISLAVSEVDKRWVTLYGTVADANEGGNPSGLTVTFTGACAGSAVTNTDGSYAVTVEATSLGTVHATVNNSANLGSNEAEATIYAPPPTINNFQVIHQTSNLYTLAGSVTAAPAAGLTISFSGFTDVSGQSVTVEADCSFSLTLALSASDCGLITAQLVDWWSVSTSAQAYVDAS